MAPQVIAVVLGTLFTFSLQQVSGEISNTTCGEYPPPPAGSTQQCYPTSCMATCTDPLRFPNGAKTIVISCRNNIWIPTNGGFTSIPNCQVQCSPACGNGQKCFYPFVECHCPDGFGGQNCKDAVTCPANEFHRGCADSCKTTCRARAMGETCLGRCEEGCACSASMARDDRDNCVPLEKCPCYVNDLEIEDGRVEVLQNGDQYDICTCSQQQWTCRQLTKGYAALFGVTDNIAMLDGKITKYPEVCGAYYLLKDEEFSLILEMNTMGLPSRTLTINMPGMVVRLLQNKKLVVNAETITSLPFQQLNFKVWLASSKYILAQLPNGIEIQWDGTTIANIFIPPTLFGEMQGLLGQYNGMKNELYLTSDGEYTNSSTVFVESWRVDQEYQCIVPRNTKSSTNCTLQSIPSNIETFCNKIYGPTFTDCNKLIENTTTLSYYEVCVLEACACDSITCSCPVLSNYASQCKNNHGLNMGNWVFPECVTTCPEGQSYQYCRSSCSTSCSSQAMHPKCKTECVEGCNCPEGQSVDNSGKCINSTQCSCFYNGIAYNNNAKMVRPSGNVDADICTCKESTWVCEKQSWVTCSSWGDPAYRTFDGQTFLFQGRSSYTLVQHSDFIIEATNKKRGQGSVTESLTIRINGMKIELLQNSQLRVDGKKINKLPWEKVGVIKVYKTSHAHSSAVELHNHVKIDWDGKTRFTISLPGILYGTVKGLCGTFNGNETDDFEMPSGDLASSWDNFGNSWKVDPNLPPEITNPHPCDNDETLAKQAEEYCSSIKKGEFKKCHSHLKPDAFYESCRFDVCVLENSTSVCPHFASYDYECRKKNVVLDWIHDVEQCSVTCPAGQEYKLCGNLCTRSCRDISFNTECDSFCVEGCYCPDGKTLDDYGKCVALTSCNCYYNGIKYQNGKEITQLDLNGDPQRCKCDKGNWTCSPIPDATCSGFGDPHYITFDGARYDFQGSCKYYLLWNNQFAVIGENRPCSVGSHVTCTKSVTVRIMGGIEIQLLQGKTVILNGTTVATLPVVEDNFEIRMHSGYWVEVLLWNGVKINYNGFHEFSITVPGTFYGKTEGLCGTFNGNKNDEYRTSYGNYVNKSSINEFGDSWRTESCNGTGNYQHPCELNPTISTQKCDALNGNIFKDCHSLVPVDTFFDSCKYDLCAGGGSEELCAAMMTYAAECASHGAIIDWRKHVGECKISCPSGQVYEACGNPCTQTCSDITRERKCIGRCVEGCRCPGGAVLDSNNKCVQPFQCSCVYQGKHYNNEDKIVKSGKDKQHCTEKDDDSKENSSEESSEESSEDNDDREEGSCGSNDKNDEIELCTCVSGKWSCKKQEGARCSVAEDKHFKTFDKRKYDFVGKCGYILLQTTNTSIETALQRCSETRKKYSCTSGIIIKHNNIKISLSSPDEVRFNGLKINRFPYKYDGVEIRKSGSKYFVTLTDGIEIQWDGPKKNYIDVPGRFFASTKGLCGNFNNIKDDDLQIDGKIVSNVYDFVNSWKVDESCGVAIPPSPPCEANSTIQSAAKNYCNGIYNNEFSECHGAVDVEPFYSNCVDDVCSCDGDIECRCTMLGMYADECSEMGIHVNWRQRNQCGGYCAAGQEFQVCGDSCALTCRDVQLNSNCKSKCVEGCRCPRGKILNDYGICIPLESCSCIYNDREYSQGDTIVKQQGVDTSEICQCGEGRWTCRDQNNGVCSAINNKYISTFNGINFNASKLCSYYLMKIPGFSVVSTSGHCSQQEVPCLANIKLEYENSIIKLYQNYGVVFNNEGIDQLPFINENINIRMVSSVFVVVEFPNGINVFWDGSSRAFITVPPSFYGKTEGLCGSFSDDDTDLITRWGTVTEDTTEFAKSWQVNDVCQPEEEIVNKCENSTIRQYAENLCQPLLNIIGFACSEVVDALLYYENCMESVCTGNTSESDVCYIFSIYADECAANGIIVDWRKRIPSCIYQCQNQEVYERCSSSQFRTCRDLSLPPNNINTCFEGCNCPHGFLLDDSQQCVPMIECSCYSDGQSYSAGESVIKTSNNNVEKCVCKRGTWQCTELSGGRCSNIGFSHFITFDGLTFNFLSNCKFYLVRSEHFTVETEIDSCKENEVLGQPGSSCKKSTTIRIGNLVIDLKQNNEIFINSEKVTELPLTIQGVQIRNTNLQTLVVTLPSGAEILWNTESSVYIDVPATYIGATEGLCGVFNHDIKDDMTTSWGQVNNSLKVFANSWLVDPMCKDCPTEVKSCENYPEIKETAESMCSVLNKTLFQPCHSMVNFEASYTVCTLELCSSSIDVSYGCIPIRDYALKCAEHGIIIDWMDKISFCVPDCPAGLVYKTCRDSCATSCRDISSNINCDSKCVEGCGCPVGQAFDTFGHCVPTRNCTCDYRGSNYNIGAQILRPVQGVEPLSLEICICDGGKWTCKAATPEDLENIGGECLD